MSGVSDDMRAAYADGYKRGEEWPDGWANHAPPGGPFAHNEETKAIKEEWRRGWRAGFAAKMSRKTEERRD